MRMVSDLLWGLGQVTPSLSVCPLFHVQGQSVLGGSGREIPCPGPPGQVVPHP